LTRIVLIRHAKTEWNEGEQERFRGRADLALSEFGIKQAELTADRIAGWPISAIYSSPLKRALSTAEILASPLGLKTRLLNGLIDIDYGTWQGLSLPEAAADDNQLYELWLQNPHLVTFPGGEKLQQVQKRAYHAMKTLLPKHESQTIVLISHKVVCKLLICRIIGLDNSRFWQVEQDTCAINLIESREEFLQLTLLNDTCHLKSLNEN
jgi:broad specificity phosphatase PhoE